MSKRKQPVKRAALGKNTTKNSKLLQLKRLIWSYKKVIVAYSGGVDSTSLLKACLDVLGTKNVSAAKAISSSYAREELNYAKSTVKDLGVNHFLIKKGQQ